MSCIKLEKDVATLNHTLNVPLLRNFSANFAPRIRDAAILKIWNVTYKMKTFIPLGIFVLFFGGGIQMKYIMQ